MSTQSNGTPAALSEINASYLGDGPDWLTQLRENAMARFVDLGLPTIRHEDWRFTNLASLRQTAFALPDGEATPLRADVKQFVISGLDCIQLVFVNGQFIEELSDLSDIPPGVTLMSLAQAISVDHPLLREHLAEDTDWHDDALASLNEALAGDGVLLHVPKGMTVEKPIHMLNISMAKDMPLLMNSRNLIVAEQSASVILVEDYVALGDDVYFNNALTKIIVGDNADVTHYLIARDNDRAFNNSLLKVHQGRDSRLASHSMLFGGRMVRNNVHPVLEGDNCFSLLNGLYVIEGEQTADSHMLVEHKALAGDSRQYYKGIMHDKAKGVFRGRIVVHPGAQKTDAKQSNQNLLLSKQASANTDPQLEIYADDVKCTHGATIGQINEDHVFYLMARGIPRDLARSMIIVAFASESLDRITNEPIRRLMHGMLFDRLPEAGVLSQLL
jgi:Fe-S cluster assembly protein SufD